MKGAVDTLPLFVACAQVDILEGALAAITRAKTDTAQLAAIIEAEAVLKNLARLKAAHAAERARLRPEGGGEYEDDDGEKVRVDVMRIGEVRPEGRYLWSVRIECALACTPVERYDVLVEAPRDSVGWRSRIRRGPIPSNPDLAACAKLAAVREVRRYVEANRAA